MFLKIKKNDFKSLLDVLDEYFDYNENGAEFIKMNSISNKVIAEGIGVRKGISGIWAYAGYVDCIIDNSVPDGFVYVGVY